MSRSKYNSVYQRPPIPIPTDWDGVRRMVQVMESILDDIYRRYGRLAMEDLSAETAGYIENASETASSAKVTATTAKADAAQANANAAAAQKDAAAARAVQSTTPSASITQAQINAWANEAAERGAREGYSGAELSYYISSYVQQKINEAS